MSARDESVASDEHTRSALNAVLEAHSPFEISWGYGPVEFCRQCADQGVPQEQAEYPCATVRIIENVLNS